MQLPCAYVHPCRCRSTLLWGVWAQEAFVNAAKFFGYKFVRRSSDTVVLEVHGKPTDVRLVCMLPYSQMRKMMSIIVQDASVGGRC